MNLKLIDEQSKNKSSSHTWTASTGLRVLLELSALMKSPRTTEQLADIIKKHPEILKEVSKDTILFDINTLRAAGCIIEKTAEGKYCRYILKEHPFKLHISDEELSALQELREILSDDISLKEAFILNDLYEKTAMLTINDEIIQNVNNMRLPAGINMDIADELLNPNINGKRVSIKYLSPEYGAENIDVVPIKLVYENKKAYLCAYNFKYGIKSFFEISRIKKINSVSINNENIPEQNIIIVYEIFGEALNGYKLKDYEKIIEKASDRIKIEAQPESEFMFVQRLMLLGGDFRVISPDIFREKIINKIKLIKKRYKNV